MLHAVTFHMQNGSMTQRHYHGGKCLAYRFRWWAGAVAVCRFLWGSLARWNAAWQHTAVDLCPCVSPGVWLFSNFCPHPAGPQSDAFPFLFFPLLLPLFAQGSPFPIPPFFIPTSSASVSSKGHKEGRGAALLYICILNLFFLFIASTFGARSRSYMYHLASFAGHLSVSLSWAVILEWLISQRVE